MATSYNQEVAFCYGDEPSGHRAPESTQTPGARMTIWRPLIRARFATRIASLFAQHGQTLTGESPEHAQIVGIAYDPNGNRTRIVYPDGSKVSF